MPFYVCKSYQRALVAVGVVVDVEVEVAGEVAEVVEGMYILIKLFPHLLFTVFRKSSSAVISDLRHRYSIVLKNYCITDMGRDLCFIRLFRK